LARELVDEKVDLIVAVSALGAREVKRTTSTIPMVFVIVSDPVAAGLVDSLARPGGNATGLSIFGTINNPRYVQYAADILRSGQHLLVIINSVLDLAKGEAGKLRLDREIVGLRDILECCVTMVREQCVGAKLALNIAPPNEPLQVSGELAKLRQIFLNLLSNGIKFIELGGAISVLAAASAGGSIEVQIIDTGIGIAPDGRGAARHYPRSMAPFSSIAEPTAAAYADLFEHLPPGRGATVSAKGGGAAPRVGYRQRASNPANGCRKPGGARSRRFKRRKRCRPQGERW
jgi:ABC transporter substrate binding protein/histidine kinase/DNA gyrase B/HSP90-like ATPase